MDAVCRELSALAGGPICWPKALVCGWDHPSSKGTTVIFLSGRAVPRARSHLARAMVSWYYGNHDDKKPGSVRPQKSLVPGTVYCAPDDDVLHRVDPLVHRIQTKNVLSDPHAPRGWRTTGSWGCPAMMAETRRSSLPFAPQPDDAHGAGGHCAASPVGTIFERVRTIKRILVGIIIIIIIIIIAQGRRIHEADDQTGRTDPARRVVGWGLSWLRIRAHARNARDSELY
jgi:hypothetical protein